MLKLRDYQEEAAQSIFDYYIKYGKKGNPIIVAATGAGKSLIIGNLIYRLMTEYTNQRILMCTHIKELIEQNYSKLISFWPDAPVGIYSAGIGKKQPWMDIVCGGIQSMHKKAENFGKRDFLFIDESHLLSPSDSGMYMSFINDLKKINPYLKIIGFTATPWRLKGGNLLEQKNAIFTDICYEIGIGELVKKGHLAPLISKSSLIQANMSEVKLTAGEFNLKQAEFAVDKEELTQAALNEVENLAAERKNFIFFCSGLQHSQHIKEALIKRGWEADIITCNTPKAERAALLSKFKHSTNRQALINNAILTTGIDLPNIDCIVLLRATMSSVLYIQMLGRGIRLFKDKLNCLVLDFAGNIERFGAVDLIKMPKGNNKKKGTGIVPQKICNNCREPVPIMLMICPSCNYAFPEIEKPKHDEMATSAAIMASEIQAERHEVASIKYYIAQDKNNNNYVRIAYYDSWSLIASEFIHFAYGLQRVILIWKERKKEDCIETMPINATQFVEKKDFLNMPKAIFTKKSGAYQEVVDYEF